MFVDVLRVVKILFRGVSKSFRMLIVDIIIEVCFFGGVVCGGKIEVGSLMKG